MTQNIARTRMTTSRKNKTSRAPALIVLGLIACAIVGAAVLGAKHMQERRRIRSLQNPVAATAAAVADGKQIYGQHCQNCHGVNGDGKGQRAAELSTMPSDFTDASKRAGITDGEMYWQITKGQQPMPAFEDKLSEEKRWEAVDYIRTFAQKPNSASQ